MMDGLLVLFIFFSEKLVPAVHFDIEKIGNFGNNFHVRICPGQKNKDTSDS